MLAALLLAFALQRETVADIRIHGNTLTPDAEILRLADIAIGAPVEPTTAEQVAARLRSTRRFEKVEVLKRFASIADPSQILLVIVVDEGPVQIERTGDPNRPVQVVKNRRINLLFLPVFNAEDGYGVTYGARLALPDPVGKSSRLAFPLTWGGDKRAALELEKTLTGTVVDRVTAGASISRRTNPFFDRDDDRLRVWARGEREVAPHVRVGAAAGTQRITFPVVPGGTRQSDTYPSAGADVVLDTRVDPLLPRNAIYARAGYERIAGVNRADFDVRGYVGVVGQTVAALRLQRSGAGGALPLALKPLLGGMSNLRGFAAGTAAGDTLLATSAELIVPLTSPLSFGKLGLSAFIDAGTVYEHGQRLADQDWRQGIGGSVWFTAAFLRLNVAVAHGRGSSTRVHVGANVAF